MNHKTVFDKDFKILDSDYEYEYQLELTKKLDFDTTDFSQSRLNEIVLWKVNRYADFDEKVIMEINSISPYQEQIDLSKTRRILKILLKTKGVQLAMASSILRFRNSKIYQIIDQRVYRIIYERKELKLSSYLSKKNIEIQIELYLRYLTDLKKVCSDLNIKFEKADRILFMADKRLNKKYKLKNY